MSDNSSLRTIRFFNASSVVAWSYNDKMALTSRAVKGNNLAGVMFTGTVKALLENINKLRSALKLAKTAFQTAETKRQAAHNASNKSLYDAWLLEYGTDILFDLPIAKNIPELLDNPDVILSLSNLAAAEVDSLAKGAIEESISRELSSSIVSFLSFPETTIEILNLSPGEVSIPTGEGFPNITSPPYIDLAPINVPPIDVAPPSSIVIDLPPSGNEPALPPFVPNKRPKPTGLQRIVLVLGRVLEVHACVFTAAALIYRLFKAAEAGKSINNSSLTAEFNPKGQVDSLIRINEKDSVVVKFIKWSMNAYDPLNKFYAYYDQFTNVFGPLGEEHRISEEAKKEFVKNSLGESAAEFIERLTRTVTGEGLQSWRDSDELKRSLHGYSSLPGMIGEVYPKNLEDQLVFADFLSFLIRDESSKLTLEPKDSSFSVSVLGGAILRIGFDNSVLHSDSSPIYSNCLTGTQSFIKLLDKDNIPGISLLAGSSGRSIIAFKSKSFIGKELEKKKKKHQISLLVPRSFCEESTTKTIDESLLTIMDPIVLAKHLSLTRIRDEACAEGVCGALRVDVALHSPPKNGCTEVEYEIDFFPAPFPDGLEGKSLNSLLSILSPLDITLPDVSIKQKYLEQRVSPFELALPGNLRHGEVNMYLNNSYTQFAIDTYKSGLTAGLHENLKIASFKSEPFYAGCMTRFQKIGESVAEIFNQSFQSEEEEEVVRLQEEFLFVTSGRMERVKGYSPEFISCEKKAPVKIGSSNQAISLGYFYTKVSGPASLSGVPVDDDFDQRLNLVTKEMQSLRETGSERFQYVTGSSSNLPVFARLVNTSIETGDHQIFQGQGDTTEAAKTVAEAKWDSRVAAGDFLTEISHASGCQTIPSTGAIESYSFLVGRDQVTPSPINNLSISMLDLSGEIFWTHPFGDKTSFFSYSAAIDFIEGVSDSQPPIWESLTDIAFSEFLSEFALNSETTPRTINDFDKTIIGTFEAILSKEIVGMDYYYIRNSKYPYPKELEIKYTLKPGLTPSVPSTATSCTYSLTAAPIFTVKRYNWEIIDRSYFKGTATLWVKLPVYKVCQSRALQKITDHSLPVASTPEDPVVGDYRYTYPSGSLQTFFEAGAKGGLLTPQIRPLGSPMTVAVKSHFSAALTLWARTPDKPTTTEPTFFIKGFPLINLRTPTPKSKTFDVKIDKRKKEITVNRSEVIAPEGTSFYDIAEHLSTELQAENPTRTDIRRKLNTQIVGSQTIGAYTPGLLNPNKANQITMEWTESLRFCHCDSASSDDFFKNLYYGESYYLRVKRKVAMYSFSEDGACKEITARNDGSVLYPESERLEATDGFVSLITFGDCASETKEKSINLVIR